MNNSTSNRPSPSEIVSEAFRQSDIRPTIDFLHGLLSLLDGKFSDVEKNVGLLEEALNPVSLRNPQPPVSLSNGGTGSTGFDVPQPAMCPVSDLLNGLRARMENLGLRLDATCGWLGTIKDELRI